MTIKESKKAVFKYIQDLDLGATEAFEFAELVEDLVEAAKKEKEDSFDKELQRLYHLVYNQAVAAARETFMQMGPTEEEEPVAELEEVVNV